MRKEKYLVREIEVVYSCGHHGKVTFFSTSSEYEKRAKEVVEDAAARRCPACVRKETEALNAAFAAERNLPEIIALDKAYNDKTHLRNANTNRRMVLQEMEEAMARPEAGSTSLSDIYQNLCRETSVRFWLENRYEIEEAVLSAVTKPSLTELHEVPTISGPIYIVRPRNEANRKKGMVHLRIAEDTVYMDFEMRDCHTKEKALQRVMSERGFCQNRKDPISRTESWEKTIKFRFRPGILEELCADTARALLNEGFTVALPSKELKDMVAPLHRVFCIDWDTDGEDVDLPSEVELPANVPDEEIADTLSDMFGFCVKSFKR